jgi:hypothetical protein
MGARSLYKGFYLDELRVRVISAYYRNRKFENKDDKVIECPNNYRNNYYKLFSDDVFKITKVLISKGTIFKLLYFKNQNDIGEYVDRPFDTTIVEAFEKYANTIQTPQGLVSENFTDNELKGAQLVDLVFRKKMESDKFIPNKTDFYLSKKENDCQWRGVVRNWDCPRDARAKVKDQVIDSFNWESRVAAVIHGSGGCGKSTFLRRLAIDCINENFRVLWVNDLENFCDEDLNKISDSPLKYLCVIEDWHRINNNESLIKTFLNRILKFHNVRIVIGDRSPIEQKEYYKYLIEDGEHELLQNENDEIIRWVLGLYDPWKKSGEKIFLSKEIYNAPIFLILFVLANDYQEIDGTHTKDVLSIFRDIVANDMKRIDQVYPGLARALFYWAHLYNIYHRYMRFTWQAVLKLADFYTPSNIKVSSRFSIMDESNPFWRILFRYFSFELSFIPAFKNAHFIDIHHNLLIEKGLSIPINEDWYFDDNIKIEILMILMENEEKYLSIALYEIFNWQDKQFLLNDTQKKYFEMEIDAVPNWLISGFFMNDAILRHYYLDSEIKKDEEYWQKVLVVAIILMEIESNTSNCKYLSFFLKSVIDRGCIAKCITDAYRASQSNH